MTAYQDSATGTVTCTPSVGGEALTLVDEATGTVTCTPSVGGEALTLVDEATGTVTCTPHIPHVFIFVDIDNFNTENWTVSKNINDTMWTFSANIDGVDVPTLFRNLRITAVGLDRASPPNETNYVIFLGFIPGSENIFKTADNKSQITGYDTSWYLAAQAIPSTQTVTDEDINPATLVKTLLGDNDSLKTTGLTLTLGNIVDVSTWSTIKKPFKWKFDTQKQKAISEIVDYTSSIFHVKFVQFTGLVYYPAAYFVEDIDHATEGLDLPAIATFTDPDSYLIDISMEVNESDEINRVIVHGTNRETGLWKNKTEESAAVTSGDTIPRELVIASYVPEPPPADAAALQTAVDAKAAELYTLFHTNATTSIIRAKLKRRADLELWQKIGFVGYSGIPEYSSPSTNVMRIVSISYHRAANEDIVEITCIPTKDLSNETARRMALGADEISGQQDIIYDALQGMAENEVGEVTAITGSVATVELEKDGKSVEARILNP